MNKEFKPVIYLTLLLLPFFSCTEVNLKAVIIEKHIEQKQKLHHNYLNKYAPSTAYMVSEEVTVLLDSEGKIQKDYSDQMYYGTKIGDTVIISFYR